MADHTLDELAAAFTALTLPKPAWTHAAQLRVGAWHVHHLGAERALETLRPGIRRLNESHGGVNTASAGYHETITAAYVRVIAQFLAATDASTPLDTRVAELVVGPLGHRELLFRFWSRERLLSNEARAAWLEPDLAPLDVTSLLGR